MTKGSLRRSLICHSYVIHNIHPSIHPDVTYLFKSRTSAVRLPTKTRAALREPPNPEPRRPVSRIGDLSSSTRCSPGALPLHHGPPDVFARHLSVLVGPLRGDGTVGAQPVGPIWNLASSTKRRARETNVGRGMLGCIRWWDALSIYYIGS